MARPEADSQQQVVAAPRRVSAGTIATYAIGSLGTGGFATLPGLVLVYFLTDTLGIAALAAGALVTAAKVWDVVIDPVIGAWSDRSLARTGSRRRFMVLGGVLLPVFFLLTFAVPAGLPDVAAGLWVLVAFTATATAFSLFQVPYIALPAELSSSYDERTRLLSVRVVVLTLAILLFGAGGPSLRRLGGDDEHLGYLLMALVAGVVIGLGMLVSSRVAPRRGGSVAPGGVVAPGRGGSVVPGAVRIRDSYRLGFAALRRSRPFRALLGTFGLQALATGMMLAGAQYVATWVLHDEGAVDVLFVALIGPALLFAPVWQAVARRIGKERGFVAASVLFGVAALALTLLAVTPGEWLFVPVGLAGAGYAGMQSLPMAMLPDVITHDARATGADAAGTFGGVWTAGETTGMALGSTALTIVLAVTGYIAWAGTTEVVQPASAVLGIVLAFSVVPAAFLAASLVVFRGYRLRRADADGVADAGSAGALGESAAGAGAGAGTGVSEPPA
ncbi:MFS transporter [Galbitalea sp. SE-J8]|uniref:MFS transporter n=1 Tax=Galbitalea sp. SE-J8 TaxID=3054952 RepID=UPI00259CA6DF|nr:MFS transporter [Galbitalea sp. SE-J8]MDM4764230.1 MFS transporter [Galbitalea sp. SE-J8]